MELVYSYLINNLPKWEGVDWIHMSQDRNIWWTVVDTVMTF